MLNRHATTSDNRSQDNPTGAYISSIYNGPFGGLFDYVIGCRNAADFNAGNENGKTVVVSLYTVPRYLISTIKRVHRHAIDDYDCKTRLGGRLWECELTTAALLAGLDALYDDRVGEFINLVKQIEEREDLSPRDQVDIDSIVDNSSFRADDHGAGYKPKNWGLRCSRRESLDIETRAKVCRLSLSQLAIPCIMHGIAHLPGCVPEASEWMEKTFDSLIQSFKKRKEQLEKHLVGFGAKAR